jgi:hypothetical protein
VDAPSAQARFAPAIDRAVDGPRVSFPAWAPMLADH